MSGAHCERFPSCMEFSEKPQAPKCSKPDCPGNRSWRDVMPDAFTPGPSEATPSTAGSVREALEKLLIENDDDDFDDDCELCDGRGTVDAYTRRDHESSGRDEVGCPACLERKQSRDVRAVLAALAPVEAPVAVKADCDASAAERVLSELMDRRLLNDVDDDLHQEIADALIRAARGDVSVKRIKWRGPIDAFPATIWEAKTAFGHFVIEEVSASDSPAYEVRFAGNLVAVKDDVESAKAAAQADYEQRIRSALIATAEAPVAWLRDLPGNEAKPDGRCYDVVFVDPQDARYRPLYATTRPLPSVDAKSPADEIIGQIEERFPNWRSYRDLIDCIDCTLHDLRSSVEKTDAILSTGAGR